MNQEGFLDRATNVGGGEGRIRWLRLLIAVSSAVLTIGLGQSAGAEECPPLDQTCLAAEAELTAGDTVPDVVQDVAEDADGTVTPVVNDVLDEVDRLAGGGGEPPPSGGGGGHPGSGGDGRGDFGGAGREDSPDTQLRPVSESGLIAALTASAGDPDGSIDGGSSLRDRVTAAVAGAARSFAVVLVLLCVAIGFVLIQDRLDRRDPKLVLAPVGSDVLRFA